MPQLFEKIRLLRLLPLAVGLILLSEAAPGVPQPPEELRGKVTAVAGERIHIALSQKEWLPHAGDSVQLGAEMADMFVPLKGKFVVIQVNADSVIAKAHVKEEHGTPAPGMLALLPVKSWRRPQTRAAYLGTPSERKTQESVLRMAEAGHRPSQHVIALSYQSRGDHDRALKWWERAANGAKDRFYISGSATGRAKILCNRGEFQKALTILQDAISRTKPRDDELTFAAYHDSMSGVRFHVDVLKELGYTQRGHLENVDECKRWFHAAANVMAGCATRGVPDAGQNTEYTQYKTMLRDLAVLHSMFIGDKEGAVPWLQRAARAGDKYAQKQLTDMGRSW